MTDEEIFFAYQPLVRREAARNYLPYLREDVEAVARFALMKAIRTFDPTRNVPFPGYAKSCVHNAVTTFLRQEKRLRERHGQETEIVEQTTDDDTRAEIRELLRMVLATLTLEEKKIFACLVIYGLTARATALRLGVPYSRVKSCKAMIRLKIKNLLAQ